MLYEETVSSVLVNGFLTEQFKSERGIRRGCPLSALLFILAAEMLAIRIRNNHSYLLET